jgi:hypothetical protein
MLLWSLVCCIFNPSMTFLVCVKLPSIFAIWTWIFENSSA